MENGKFPSALGRLPSIVSSSASLYTKTLAIYDLAHPRWASDTVDTSLLLTVITARPTYITHCDYQTYCAYSVFCGAKILKMSRRPADAPRVTVIRENSAQ